jgi:hypothetical protein
LISGGAQPSTPCSQPKNNASSVRKTTTRSCYQLLIDFGPDRLPAGAGIDLLLTLGKPSNSLFFPRLTFLG